MKREFFARPGNKFRNERLRNPHALFLKINLRSGAGESPEHFRMRDDDADTIENFERLGVYSLDLIVGQNGGAHGRILSCCGRQETGCPATGGVHLLSYIGILRHDLAIWQKPGVASVFSIVVYLHRIMTRAWEASSRHPTCGHYAEYMRSIP